MISLPSELDRECLDLFVRCDEFDSLEDLRAVFVTTDLAPFANSLPERTRSKIALATAVKSFLLAKRLADRRILLLPFLDTLRARYKEQDSLHGELSDLYEKVLALTQATPEAEFPRPHSRILQIVMLNALALAALAFLFYLASKGRAQLPFIQGSLELACVEPPASALALGIGLLAVFHLFWHYMEPTIAPIGDSLNTGCMTMSVNMVARILNALHPPKTPDRILVIGVLGLFVIAIVVGWSKVSLFRIASEPDPVINRFTIAYPNKQPQNLLSNSIFIVSANQSVNLNVEAANPRMTRCTWTSLSGSLRSGSMCAITYRLPSLIDEDQLTLLVESPCGLHQQYYHFFVRSVP